MSKKKCVINIDEENGVMSFEQNNFTWLELAGVSQWLEVQCRMHWIENFKRSEIYTETENKQSIPETKELNTNLRLTDT